jgi:hypothetical protein
MAEQEKESADEEAEEEDCRILDRESSADHRQMTTIGSNHELYAKRKLQGENYMECPKCHSQWKPAQSISASLASCPFCGASLAAAQETQFYDNSKDALRAIAETYGAETLLSQKLKSLFPDLAPSLSQNVKGLVFAVHEKGAAQILKGSLNASQPDREIAAKRAIQKLIEAFITREAAEVIIWEFVAALGWQLSLPVQNASPPKLVPQSASKPNNTGIQPKPQSQTATAKSTPQPQSKGANIAGTGIAAEILQGKKRNLSFGGYSWRVLDVQGGEALIITEDIVEKLPYNTEDKDVTWESCTLRQYLNGGFLQKFSNEQRNRILETNNANPDNLWYGTKGGNNTRDRIFLLSLEEVDKYFGNSGDYGNKKRKNVSGVVAKAGYLMSNEHDTDRQTKNTENKAWWWWLRSPGFLSDLAALVSGDGRVGVDVGVVNDGSGGVRPALWLNLKS